LAIGHARSRRVASAQGGLGGPGSA
jgi:hypothetical protein